MMSPPPEPGRRDDWSAPSPRFVTTAFSLVSLGALLATLFAVAQTQRLEANARNIADNMLESVRLVGRLQSQVKSRKLLIDDHIFSGDAAEMRIIKREIASLDAQIQATMDAYEPWVVLAGERDSWVRARADIAKLDEPTATALALSEKNRDADAHRIMQRIDAQFGRVDAELDHLIQINDQAAGASLRRFTSTRLWLVLTLIGIGAATVVGTFVVGRWAARHIAVREDEMTRDAHRLEARNRELDAFAGRVAHDIRGALTTMTLAMTPLSEKVPRDDRSMGILRRGTQKMEQLVDDLLALARVEALARGHCDPASVCALVAQDVAPRVEAERGALRVAVAHAEVACSEGLLRQAVTNLIENAVKYRRPAVAPAVEILGAVVDGGYDLRVSDNGVGMSRDEAAHAFEPFYRSPRMRDRPGTGLGLSIVNRVAEASGGRLSVRSELGQGSTFFVHLPLAGAAARGRGS
jgi:signal transduction histidine kinase